MTQTTSRFFDELAKLSEMDVVRREEFEAVKAMAEKAREENEDLSRRLAELESKLHS